MKECIIHAGTHKTGTTFIQARLAEARESLGRRGLHVPETGTTPQLAAHHNLAFELNEDRRFRPQGGTLARFAASLDQVRPERLLLSSEGFLFFGRNPSRIARLRQPLVERGYQIVWLFYLRGFHEWLESAYSQHVQTGTTDLHFKDWLSRKRTFPVYDPARYFGPFFETGDRVVFRSYALAKKDLLGDFLTAVGLPGFDPGSGGASRLNSRPGALQMEFLRRVAAHAFEHCARKEARELMTRARRLCSKIPGEPSFSPMSGATARELYEETRGSYEECLRMAGVDIPFEEFFPPPADSEERTFATLDVSSANRKALEKALATCLAPSR